jgi:hypothetical protein
MQRRPRVQGKVTMAGPTITVFRQVASAGAFVQVLQVSNATNQTSTRHGALNRERGLHGNDAI